MLKINYWATGNFGLKIVEAGLGRGLFNVAKVITKMRDDSTVYNWAIKHNLPTAEIKTADDWLKLSVDDVDLNLVIDYGRIIPKDVLKRNPDSWVNVHASILPQYRGAAPITAAILHGDRETGVTFMKIDEGVDTGDVIGIFCCAVLPDETTVSLREKLSNLAAENAGILDEYCAGKIKNTKQDGPASYTKKISKDDGRAEWMEAKIEERKLRAFVPWPGLWAKWAGRTIKFLAGYALDQESHTEKGRPLKIDNPDGWGIACGKGIFVPTLVQVESKKPLAAKLMPGSYPNFFDSTFLD